MAKIKVRYLTTRPGRGGTDRYYWQPKTELIVQGWKPQRLADDRIAAMAQAEALNEKLDAWRENGGAVSNIAPRSVADLVDRYKKTPAWNKLSPRTRRDYDYNFTYIMLWAGDAPAAALTEDLVEKFIATFADRPRAAQYVRGVLSLLLDHAVTLKWIPANPAAGITVDHTSRRDPIWEPEDITAFVIKADAMDHTAVGTAILLNEWLGQRPGDLLTLLPDGYDKGCLRFKQSKTGAEVILPVDDVPELKARMEQQIARNKNPDGPLIQQKSGAPYRVDTFGDHVRAVRTAAQDVRPELAALTFRTLRHTAVTRLGEAGCTTIEIAAVTGHSLKTVETILEIYLVRTKKMAANAFRKRLQQGANTND